MDWYIKMGFDSKHLRFREHSHEELAHYSKATVDIEYKFPWGWKEIEGIANRGDFDLKTHSKFSGEDLSFLDSQTGEKYIPYVIEPSAGLERIFLALLCEHYHEFPKGRSKQSSKSQPEVFLSLPWFLSPVKAAVLPLVKDAKLIKISQDIFKDLLKCWVVVYDERGSIGRRYRRQDEIGTPYCLTVDFDTLKDNSVTIRDYKTMEQERVKIPEIKNYLEKKFILV